MRSGTRQSLHAVIRLRHILEVGLGSGYWIREHTFWQRKQDLRERDVLQAVYRNPDVPLEIRIMAAGGALRVEKPVLSTS